VSAGRPIPAGFTSAAFDDTTAFMEQIVALIQKGSGGIVSADPVTVSSAAILAGGPVTIIPAQGPNTVILVLAAYYTLGAGTAYTATDSLSSGLYIGGVAADQGDNSVETGGGGSIISGNGLTTPLTNATGLINQPVVWQNNGPGSWISGTAPLTVAAVYAVFNIG
jgi:hypothetical protein